MEVDFDLATFPGELQIPAVGDFNAYLSAVAKMPMLTFEQERDFGFLVRDHGDKEAAKWLVLSHLRLVASIARQFSGYGMGHEDLVQEGTIGLLSAVQKFDPDKGYRLVTYALYYIKAAIQSYVMANAQMVRMVTTKNQKKLFFNLRGLKQQVLASAAANGECRSNLSVDQVQTIAAILDVRPDEVEQMDLRFEGGDSSLEGDEYGVGLSGMLRVTDHEPTVVLEAQERMRLSQLAFGPALDCLDARSRFVIESRWVNVGDDGSEAMTLHDLAVVYGVSTERIRQIEANALRKMRQYLEDSTKASTCNIH